MYGLFEGMVTISGKPGGNIPANILLSRWEVKMGNFPPLFVLFNWYYWGKKFSFPEYVGFTSQLLIVVFQVGSRHRNFS